MKIANFSIALIASQPPRPPRCSSMSFGHGGELAGRVSSRSVWKSSLVMPISTL